MEIGEDDPVKMRETRRRKKIVRRCIMVMMRMAGGIGSIVMLTAVNREYEIEKIIFRISFFFPLGCKCKISYQPKLEEAFL